MEIRTGFFVLMVSIVAGGCASPWQQFYKPNPPSGGLKYPPTDNCQIRTLEFDRFEKYAEMEKQRLGASNKAPEDFSASEKLAYKNRFLEMLRVPERNDKIGLLGTAEFVIQEPIDPYDGRLKKFAQEVGADYVVVMSKYLGQTNAVVNVPVTTYAQSTSTANVYGSRGYAGTATIDSSGTATTFVPTTVTRNNWTHTGFFLRKMRPGDPPR